MNKKIFIILLVTISFIIAIISVVYAFFSTYAEAEGSVFYTVYDEWNILFDQNMEDNMLNIRIKNQEEQRCFVRIKIGKTDFVSFELKDSNNWEEKSDGYYYYKNPIGQDEQAVTLKLKINLSKQDKNNFNIITNVEATKVLCDDNGNVYGDWENGYYEENKE